MIDFNKYDQDNPEIWILFKKYSLEAMLKGFKNYSANGIFEVIRWHTGANGNDNFKVNNNYRPDYARKMMTENEAFRGFFRIREIRAYRPDEQPII